uniref:Uncharacterized protein n=1 Tax=Arundo donax TaxID=35708 RepID=A0A0A8ZB29_ARUDO
MKTATVQLSITPNHVGIILSTTKKELHGLGQHINCDVSICLVMLQHKSCLSFCCQINVANLSATAMCTMLQMLVIELEYLANRNVYVWFNKKK